MTSACTHRILGGDCRAGAGASVRGPALTRTRCPIRREPRRARGPRRSSVSGTAPAAAGHAHPNRGEADTRWPTAGPADPAPGVLGRFPLAGRRREHRKLLIASYAGPGRPNVSRRPRDSVRAVGLAGQRHLPRPGRLELGWGRPWLVVLISRKGTASGKDSCPLARPPETTVATDDPTQDLIFDRASATRRVPRTARRRGRRRRGRR